MVKGNTQSEAEVFANSDLAKIEKWAKENKMQFNEVKSKAVLITRKRKNKNINISSLSKSSCSGLAEEWDVNWWRTPPTLFTQQDPVDVL
jgi:hypothetical protein